MGYHIHFCKNDAAFVKMQHVILVMIEILRYYVIGPSYKCLVNMFQSVFKINCAHFENNLDFLLVNLSKARTKISTSIMC